jgi:hypothetical protein
MRRAGVHVGILFALTIAWFAIGRGQPLVRNGLVYARAAWNVAAAGYDPRPVVADSHLSYDKPVGFALLASPLVARFGAHDGLRIASLLGALAYVAAVALFAKALLPGEERSRARAALLWLASFGPLVACQAWSAHPDAWFAALFVVAVALSHRLATGDDAGVPRRALLLAVVFVAAFLLKNYALILLPSCALYIAVQLRAAAHAGRRARRLAAWSGAALLPVLAFTVAARLGWNPLSRLEGEGGGADQYAFAKIGSIWWKTLAQLGIALALQFHVVLIGALRRTSLARDVLLPALCFGAIYVAGLTPFPTAFYNMRYFQPLFPLAALAVVRGAEAWPAAARRLAFTLFLLVNGATTLVWNVPSLFDRVRPRLPDTRVRWLENGPPLALLDNLRMEQHRDQAAWLATLNERAEPGARVYLLDVDYYRDAQRTVFERDGFLRPDLRTTYVSRRELRPEEPAFYVWSYGSPPPPLERYGRVTPLGNRVFRVESPPDPGTDSAPASGSGK